MHDLDSGESLNVVGIEETQVSESFDLLVCAHSSPTRCSTFEIDGWKRFVCEVAVPHGKFRSGTATDETTAIGIALPVSDDTVGRIHVALPTAISTGESSPWMRSLIPPHLVKSWSKTPGMNG
jgi:hypothetical protein